MPKKCPYLLTLDTKKHNWNLKKFHKEISLFLYRTTPNYIEYTFYVEVGMKGNPHAHGWFDVPDQGALTVLGCCLRRYKSRFGRFFHSERKSDKSTDVGAEYLTYCTKDQKRLAEYWKSTVQDIVINRSTGKSITSKQTKKTTLIKGIIESLGVQRSRPQRTHPVGKAKPTEEVALAGEDRRIAGSATTENRGPQGPHKRVTQGG